MVLIQVHQFRSALTHIKIKKRLHMILLYTSVALYLMFNPLILNVNYPYANQYLLECAKRVVSKQRTIKCTYTREYV